MSQSAKPKLGFEVTEQSAVPRAKPKLGFEVMETEVSRDLRGGGGDSNFTNTDGITDSTALIDGLPEIEDKGYRQAGDAGDGHHNDDDDVKLTVIDVPPPSPDIENNPNNLCFRNSDKRIDFVLSYHQGTQAHAEARLIFENNLRQNNLELEHEDKETSQDRLTFYTKIHAPWVVLSKMAQFMRIKVPIKKYDIEEDATTWLESLSFNPFTRNLKEVPEEESFFTADYNEQREDFFLIEDKATLFTPAQRSAMVYEILMRCAFEENAPPDEGFPSPQYTETEQQGEEEEVKNKVGIDRCIRRGYYDQAFPLHDSPFFYETSQKTPKTDRQILYSTWARFGLWYSYQPLDLIRRYMGEKIGIYFAWLGFYTVMLIPPSIIGVCVFFYGVWTLGDNFPSEDICNEAGAGNFIMCPLCDGGCPYWRLKSSCTYAKLTYLFDNKATVFFACFMAVWASVFLELWKRKQAELQYDWDVANFQEEERIRPDYEMSVKDVKMNPITKMLEPFLPMYSKFIRQCTSAVVIFFMISLVLGALFGVIIYRMIIVGLLYAAENAMFVQNAKIITTVTAACINLVVIILLNRIYQEIAVWLTKLECPRTDTEYQDSFTFKMFLFQFINFYSAIFYVAFVKGRLVGRPGAYDYRLGDRAEECDPAGCLIELCIQLAIVMVGKQAFNNFKEILLPKMMNYYRQKRTQKEMVIGAVYTRWEQDADLEDQTEMGLFDEYLEMVVQYGFVTIFVAAFPLAPFFALLNNVFEVRLDAYKLITQWKRPVAMRAEDIGVWYTILKSVSFFAVLSNAFIISLTSDFIPKIVYTYVVSEDRTLAGYLNSSLSVFNVSQLEYPPYDLKVEEFGNVTVCRYPAYRHPPGHDDEYGFTSLYWHILVARLAFVIIFEHCVFLFTWLVTVIIPDVPMAVKTLMLREIYLAKEARFKQD